MARYAERTGRDVANVGYYEVLGVFKLAVIIQQIYRRFHRGQTQDERFRNFGERANALARLAARLAEQILTDLMTFEFRRKSKDLQQRLTAFMDEHIYPNERRYHEHSRTGRTAGSRCPIIEELKPKARAAGLWNLFLPESEHGAGLTNLEYAPLCEIMGRVAVAPEVFNCSAPDTGNMEVLVRYGTAEQKERWLEPLLAGEIRSCFAMTEPEVASSDATNIAAAHRARRRRLRHQRPQVVDLRRRRPALQDRHLHGQDRSRRRRGTSSSR